MESAGLARLHLQWNVPKASCFYPHTCINGLVIQCSDKVRYLGVSLDHQLTFSDPLCRRIASAASYIWASSAQNCVAGQQFWVESLMFTTKDWIKDEICWGYHVSAAAATEVIVNLLLLGSYLGLHLKSMVTVAVLHTGQQYYTTWDAINHSSSCNHQVGGKDHLIFTLQRCSH